MKNIFIYPNKTVRRKCTILEIAFYFYYYDKIRRITTTVRHKLKNNIHSLKKINIVHDK